MKTPNTIALTTIGKLQVSTVHLGDFHHGIPYETCVFYATGESNVVGTSKTYADALQSHARAVGDEVEHLALMFC
jgi:hypothetical protein